MSDAKERLLRKIPSVESLLQDGRLADAAKDAPRSIVADSARQAVEHFRKAILAGEMEGADESAIRRQIAEDAARRVQQATKPQYRRVVNATGIILHTGLGRAVLAERALKRITKELGGYSLLQVDIETGKRSRRDERIEVLLRHITGAEAATVVNNNAAATAIVLNTVAKGREVIVSRGQLVEIGGSFRLPEVMAFSGARLVEVGTTNRTHPRDYENAVTENTAAIMRVHPSNYKVEGFTAEVPINELAEIAHKRGLVLIDDLGAGALIDFSRFGFEPEPTIAESIQKGADIVTCSADKLIGAAQAGIILGKAQFIEMVRKNQFARIVRPGKLALSVLETTLEMFLDEKVALSQVPTLQMLARDTADITRQAKRMKSQLVKRLGGATVTTMGSFSQMGSGSLPGQNLATTLVAIKPGAITAEELAKRLREYAVPVFARIQDDTVLIDPRTLRDDDEKVVIEALVQILGGRE